MALPTASDNPFPSLLITEGTEPSAPAAGKQRLYIDSTTHKLKRTDSSGVDVTIEDVFHGVSLTHSADLTISNGSEAALSMDTENFDTDGYHDTVTNNNRITIPAGLGGYYVIDINLRPNNPIGSYAVARLNVTSGGTILALPAQQPTGPILYSMTASVLVSLAAGDFVWFGQSGSGVGVFLKPANGAPLSWVSMYRVGV